MGFAARKSKSGEVTLTTEMVQDGMLFITNLLFINKLTITKVFVLESNLVAPSKVKVFSPTVRQ